MKSAERREMFKDLYRLAECYEDPPFRPGDIEGNAAWFVEAQEAQLLPFLEKYRADPLAQALGMAVMDEASKRAAELNKEVQP